MLKINVPQSPWSEQSVTLNGTEYRFIFSFNERDKRFRLDVYVRDKLVISGLGLMENGLLLGPYQLEDFNHGDLFCVRIKSTTENVTLGNLGFNKEYELVYLTNKELLELAEA